MCGIEVNLICPLVCLERASLLYNKIFYPSISSIYLWSPFNKLYAIHKRFVVNQFVCFQQIFLDDEVLKVLNILKLDAVVFVGTTWEQCPA